MSGGGGGGGEWEGCKVKQHTRGFALPRNKCFTWHDPPLSPCAPPTQCPRSAVRVCERCHLRVGLLNQMAAAVDSIRTIGAVLPPSMSGYFRGEVLEAVMSTNEAAAAASSGSSGSAVGSSLASPFASPAGGGGGGAPATPARA